jgi:4-hydroxymandelate oxidase
VAPDTADLERRARALLPPDVYDFLAGGAGQEVTLRANVAAWRRHTLLPRVLRDVSTVDTSVRVPGLPETTLATPIAVAPVAGQGLAHPDGERATARGAAEAGALVVLPTRSGLPVEEAAQPINEAGGAWWFQVYVTKDRDLTAALVRRAAACGARALVLTGDTPVVGRKRRDRGWEGIPESVFTANTGPFTQTGGVEQATDVTFNDIGWLTGLCGLPVVVKGVLRDEDAQACVAAGAAGVIVSNHGGRQLDRVAPSAVVLPDVVAAVLACESQAGAPVSVFADSGIRTGEDVLTALALGARAVFLGRPVLWALACGGAAGVRDLLTGLTHDLTHAMALAGAPSVAETSGLVC